MTPDDKLLAFYVGKACSSRRRIESLERKIEELAARDPRARRMAHYMRLAERAADDARWYAMALGRYVESSTPNGCTVPPAGWLCTREPGHEGPCAARPREANGPDGYPRESMNPEFWKVAREVVADRREDISRADAFLERLRRLFQR